MLRVRHGNKRPGISDDGVAGAVAVEDLDRHTPFKPASRAAPAALSLRPPPFKPRSFFVCLFSRRARLFSFIFRCASLYLYLTDVRWVVLGFASPGNAVC